MSDGPEYTQVEVPFIDQLQSMGWKFTTGNSGDPTVTGMNVLGDGRLPREP